MDRRAAQVRPGSRELLRPQSLPRLIRESRLFRRGCFDIFEGLLDERGRVCMLREAVRRAAAARLSDVPASDDEEVRGGNPARCLFSAAGGELLDAFYQATWMLEFLYRASGIPVVPTGDRGTYSYYIRPGHHLAIHRDIPTCDLAVITCLCDGPRKDGAGGMMGLYPGRLFEPLSAVRADPEQGVVRLRLLPGQTMVMFGGIIPHAIQPVAEGQARIVAVLCYRIPETGADSLDHLGPCREAATRQRSALDCALRCRVAASRVLT